MYSATATRSENTAEAPHAANPHAERALEQLAASFHLSGFEKRCLLLCLAAEIDPDCLRPTIAHALAQLCATPEEALAARAAFEPRAPLVRGRLLRVTEDAGGSPLLARTLVLDERIAGLLLGSTSVAPVLQGAAERVPAPTTAPRALDPELHRRLAEHVRACLSESAGSGLLCHLHGPWGAGKHELVVAVCAELGLPLLSCELSGLLEAPLPFAEMAWLLAREAVLQPAALCLRGFDRLLADDGPADDDRLRALLAAIGTFSRLTFVLGERPWSPVGSALPEGFLSLRIGHPDPAKAAELWTDALAELALAEPVSTGELASRFRLTPGQIRDAATRAKTLARWRSPGDGAVTGADLAAACRAQSGDALARVAKKIAPRHGWEDLVLPPDALAQLREICAQARHRDVVLGAWGFGRRLSLGKGLNVLFSGPPGTGKTLAAEVLAHALELDLYKIDLSRVVSKWIGETEKNLDRVFAAAESSSAILFFDEADALFGKRSEVRDAHDRYANVEISYLLQKMEEHEGISVLASNLKQHLDPAFLRRLGFTVHFPFPDEASRRRIWEGMWPVETPLGDDVDFGVLARELLFSGGNIKNVAVAAAFLAAADGGRVRQAHLSWAARRELQKLGKTLPETRGEAG